MCYTPAQSFFFFVIGITTAIYIYFCNKFLRNTSIHLMLLFYCAMELLQTIQYFYVNQCDNIINKILTEIAYILLIVQPLIWNIFFYYNSDKYEKYIFLTAIYLCLAWITVNVSARLLYKKVFIPQTPKDSAFASDKVCTRKLNTHLYWTWTSANLYELNANYLMYVLIWFIPALISKSSFYYAIIIIASSIIGLMYGYTNNPSELFTTFTAAWCFISIPIVLAVMFYLIYSKYYK